jgi:hypothetical protein
MRIRVDHLLLGFGAMVLLTGSLLAWRALRPDPEQAEFDQGLERLRAKPAASSNAKPRFVRTRGAFSSSDGERREDPEGWVDPQTPHVGDPGELDASEAVDTFKAVMAELETAVEDGRRLSKREQAELYNRATGSFTALSAWTDGSDPADRALIDDAYSRMMSLMRELDLEPPRLDPDHNPMRR